MNEITLKVKLEFTELIKLRFNLAYRSPSIILLSIIGLGMLLVVVFHLFGVKIRDNDDFPTYQTTFSFLSFIVIPISIFLSTRQDLISNKFISQNIQYLFSDNHFTITGETFNMQNSWTDLNKIVEYKKWFLLYTSKTQAIIIPKDRFENITTLKKFRDLIKNLDDLK